MNVIPNNKCFIYCVFIHKSIQYGIVPGFLSISRWIQSITGRIHVLQTNYYVNSEQEWWVSYRSWIFTKDFLHLINSSWCLKYCIGIYSLQNSLWTEYWIIYLVSIHFGEMDRHCIHPLLKNCWNYLSYRLGTISKIRYKWDIIVCLGYNTLNKI